MSGGSDQWKAIAFSFAAGAASMSLWMYANSLRQKNKPPLVKNIYDDDESDDDDEVDEFEEDLVDSRHVVAATAAFEEKAVENTNKRQQRKSLIGAMFGHNVEEAVEDIVGDIRARMAGSTRKRWMWEKICEEKLEKKQKQQQQQQQQVPPAPSEQQKEDVHTELPCCDQKSRRSSRRFSRPLPLQMLNRGTSAPLTKLQQDQKNPELCIGSIFGLDVGGTLAKLVYFEKRPDNTKEAATPNVRERQYHLAASAQAVLKARRGSLNKRMHRSSLLTANANNQGRRMSGASPFKPGLVRRKLSTTSSPALYDQAQKALEEVKEEQENGDETEKPENGCKRLHSADDLKDMYQLRQESLPDDVQAYANAVHFQEEEEKNGSSSKRSKSEPSGGGDEKKEDDKALKKSRSMFDLTLGQKSRDHADALHRFYHFAHKLDSYREGVKDHKLSFYSRALGGEFHFIQFETHRMDNAVELIRANDLHLTISEVGATGGGAHKFADDWDRYLGIELIKQEELESLVAGMQFALATVVGECYTFRPVRSNSQDEERMSASSASSVARTRSFGRKPSSDLIDEEDDSNHEANKTTPIANESPFSSDESDSEHDGEEPADGWWWSRKVQRDAISYASTYPYMLVMIGTGVSILRVDGPRKHVRVSGSTIGGGTYWGLIRLLTDLENFEDVMRLAEHGDPAKVDMMVGDIYGDNKEALKALGLPATLVASSFGKLVAREDPAEGLTQEDLARALLLMVTNNIGQVAYLNAQLHKTPRIYFVGNFLRNNKISQRRLSYAINYWSKGKMEALFLEHEGYYGALGAFLLSQNINLEDLQRAPARRDKLPAFRAMKGPQMPKRRSQTLEENDLTDLISTSMHH